MAAVWYLPNIGLVAKLQTIGTFAGLGDSYIRLFQNNHTVSDATTSASLVPASFAGYSPQPVGSPTYTGGVGVTVAIAVFPPVTFACTGSSPQTIYGATYEAYFAVGMIAAQNLPNGPQVVAQPGDRIIVQLTLTDQRAPGQP